MDYKWLFYWISVADNAKSFFLTVAIVISIIGLVSFLSNMGAFFSTESESEKVESKIISRKWTFFSWSIMILFWSFWIFTPSKMDALIIVGGGETMNFLSKDPSAQKIPPTILKLVETKLQSELADVNLLSLVTKTKEEVLKEASNMTGAELIEKMKSDPEFAKIVNSNGN